MLKHYSILLCISEDPVNLSFLREAMYSAPLIYYFSSSGQNNYHGFTLRIRQNKPSNRNIWVTFGDICLGVISRYSCV